MSSLSTSPGGGGIQSPKLSLLCRVNDFAREIIGAALISDDDGFITISSDRSMRVWLKRESGRFWPSVCQYLPNLPSCLAYDEQDRSIFIGLFDGLIMGFVLSDDLNSVSQKFNYAGHTGRVSALTHSLQRSWLLSTGQDKLLCWHSTQDGSPFANLSFSSPTTCVCLDDMSGCAFVGEQNGDIQFLNLQQASGLTASASKLVGHPGAVKCLYWDVLTERLFSASDEVIIIWDVGGKRGDRYELHGQPDDVNVAVGLSILRRDGGGDFCELISAYENGIVAFWDVSKNCKRLQNPEWSKADNCEVCAKPFIWSLKDMWKRKIIGVRQHHCRKCGKALCDSCSAYRSVLPQHGFEVPIRLCRSCDEAITPECKTSHATFCDTNHPITIIGFDSKSQRILSVASDRSLMVWRVEYNNQDSDGYNGNQNAESAC